MLTAEEAPAKDARRGMWPKGPRQTEEEADGAGREEGSLETMSDIAPGNEADGMVLTEAKRRPKGGSEELTEGEDDVVSERVL